MDPMWAQLPQALSDHICNQLPKVRRIPDNLSREIKSQRFLLAKLINWNIQADNGDYPDVSISEIMAYIDHKLGTGGNMNDKWLAKTPEERWEFYRLYGPR